MSNLVPVQDIERMAVAVAKSGLFGIKTPEQGVALMLIAQAEGLHPAIAARDYHIIQGRPALKADAMLARFQAAGGKVNWDVLSDTEVTGTFSHPSGGSATITWTMEMAKKAKLTGKDNWATYPRAMLRSRVTSEGIRTVFPGCVVGTYTDEETEDFAPAKAPKKAVEAKPEVEDNNTITISVHDAAEVFPFYVPGNDEPYAHFKTEEAWIEGYGKMVERIMNSPKYSEEDKTKKVTELGEANKPYISTLPGIAHARLKAAIVKAGGTVNPKAEVSPEPSEEASDTPF